MAAACGPIRLVSLIAEEIERYRVPWRIDSAIQAAVSALAALTVDEGMVRAEPERIEAPTLVLWGDQHRALPRLLADELMELHPVWAFRTVEGIGHLLPWEAPDTYVELVGDWMTVSASRRAMVGPRPRAMLGWHGRRVRPTAGPSSGPLWIMSLASHVSLGGTGCTRLRRMRRFTGNPVCGTNQPQHLGLR